MSAQQSNDPVFGIQRVYLKDLSLEIPNAPQIFLETQAPSVEIQIEVASQGLVEGIFESNVTVTVTTKAGDKVAFLVEAKQAGIFEVRNVPAGGEGKQACRVGLFGAQKGVPVGGWRVCLRWRRGLPGGLQQRRNQRQLLEQCEGVSG